MKALVTGGLGFIGSHLAEYLIKQLDYPTILDDCSNNVVNRNAYGCRIVEGSVLDVSDLFNDRFDMVYHLACFVGPVGVLKHSGKMAFEILDMTRRMLDYCVVNKTPLIYVSSSEVYGNVSQMEEDSQKVFPGEYAVRTEYGAAKMLCEIMIENTAKVTDLKYQIIRPFNVAGPRQRPKGGFVLPRFIQSALKDEPLTIYGDGTQRRAFADVRDLSRGIYEVSQYEGWNHTWNLGNPANEMTIFELAKNVEKVMGKELEFSFVDPKELHGPLFSEAPDKVPFIDKVRSLVGWEPEYDLHTTISDSIEWIKKSLRSRGL